MSCFKTFKNTKKNIPYYLENKPPGLKIGSGPKIGGGLILEVFGITSKIGPPVLIRFHVVYPSKIGPRVYQISHLIHF